MWETSMKGLVSLIRKSTPSSFTYICEKNGDSLSDKMDELACFASGMLALGSLGYGPGDREKMLTLAEEAKLQRRRQELTQTTPDQPVDDEAVYYKVAGRRISKAKLQRRRQELTQTTLDQPVDDEAVYYKVAGECPKGRVYSLRSLWRKKRKYIDPDASTSQHESGAHTRIAPRIGRNPLGLTTNHWLVVAVPAPPLNSSSTALRMPVRRLPAGDNTSSCIAQAVPFSAGLGRCGGKRVWWQWRSSPAHALTEPGQVL
ncbi:hypothetical protein Scep_030262 [Stephania cephalantha]|uniref:Uncharacterized protein n=1 Tax=Stephania cephalantha TaxID=152367 RepID=A0AAP0HGQ0_9MAGN